MNKLLSQRARIGRLPHAKNDFLTESYHFSEYPEIEQSVSAQAACEGFRLPDLRDPRHFSVQKRKFELQTHSRSVEEHTDDVSLGCYFGLLPVAQRLRVPGHHETDTVFNFILGRKRFCQRLELGKLIVFNPRAPHSLIYYGKETTFMLFSLVRARGQDANPAE